MRLESMKRPMCTVCSLGTSSYVSTSFELFLCSGQLAREWGLTAKEDPCQGVRKNREKPRDFYANETVWAAVYKEAEPELKDAMDLAYLTGQRPADVLAMHKDDIRDGYLVVEQNKTQ